MRANAHVAPPRAHTNAAARSVKTGRPQAPLLSPVLLVARRHAQVDRLHMDDLRRTVDPGRLGVDQSRLREIANVDLSVKAETLSR
jgi:hypothetical protein